MGAASHATLHLDGEARPSTARGFRLGFERWLRATGVTGELAADVGQAVYEAAANAVQHAYRPEHANRVIRLIACRIRTGVFVAVSDRGRWKLFAVSRVRGNGLALMRHLSSEMAIEATPDGTTVRLHARVPR
jgi:anti-sigma regulatory factor (Ser/Thr protein kinase)